MSGKDNIVELNPEEKRQVDERLREDFEKIFSKQAEVSRQGHDGDVAARSYPYEP